MSVQGNTSSQRLSTGGRSGVTGVWHGLCAGEVEWGGQMATGGGQRHGGFSVAKCLVLWATVLLLHVREVPMTGVVQTGSGDPQGPATAIQVT